MSVELGGVSCVARFDGATCTLTREAAPPIELSVPVTALAAVELRAPRWGRRGRLGLVPRLGADPFTAVAGGPLPDRFNPYVIEYSGGPAGERFAAGLRSAISARDLADLPSREFLVEPPPPPLSATGLDGLVGYDGATVNLWWNDDADAYKSSRGAQVLPVAALDAVRFAGGAAGHVRFATADAEPGKDPWRDPRAVLLGPGRRAAAMLAVAARVLYDLQALRRELTRPVDGLPHGLSLLPGGPGGTEMLRLEGLDGWAQFDGEAVTVHAQGTTRRIPLSAVDDLELAEMSGGAGYVRVRLVGAAQEELPEFMPHLDEDTVCHHNQDAALEFAHRVVLALREVTVRAPDGALLATSGTRADLRAALARAGSRVRGMRREMNALPAVLTDGETVRELELGWVGDEAGLLVMTSGRLLFLSVQRPLGHPWQLALDNVTDVEATWTPDRIGRLVITSADEVLEVGGLYNPRRFREPQGATGPAVTVLRPLPPMTAGAVLRALARAGVPIEDAPPGTASLLDRTMGVSSHAPFVDRRASGAAAGQVEVFGNERAARRRSTFIRRASPSGGTERHFLCGRILVRLGGRLAPEHIKLYDTVLRGLTEPARHRPT